MMFRKGKCIVPVLIALAGLLGAAGFGWLGHAGPVGGRGNGPAKHLAKKQAGQNDGRDTRAADREAIRKATQSFLKAFESGDAKAVAAHWTSGGEYVSGDDPPYRGRAALEKAYHKFFADTKDLKVEVEIESLRFLSRDSAVQEGYFKVRKDKDGERTASRFSAVFVHEGGKWLMAVLRELPGAGDNLRDLEWLIGTWKAQRDGTDVETTYEWNEKKTFIKVRFTIKGDGRTLTGTQRIGKDHSTGRLRSWTFESGGGFGEAVWDRDGKKWLVEAKGVLEDGSTLTATNILTRIDDDAFTWQSTNRTVDEDDLPDLPPIKVTRVKTRK
jgi:uncharacterized protein (TIGR02246 family)